MFIDILNILHKSVSGMTYGLSGLLLGTFLFKDFKKELDNSMALKFNPFNKGSLYGFFIGFWLGYRMTKNLDYKF